MHPLDIQETNRSGAPIEGLVPAGTLGEHAVLALEMLRGWLRTARRGNIVRTRTGGRRIMPRSVRLLARQYVYDRIDEGYFLTPVARHYARRYYTYALEVEIGQRLEDLAFLVSAPEIGLRNQARTWKAVVVQLALDADPATDASKVGRKVT
jgi:hypothetical protein